MHPTENVFESFVTHSGGQLVSQLISNNNPPKNADYLFRNPLIIAELKIVERDGFTAQDKAKLNELVETWIRERRIGPIYGTVQIELRKLPPSCQREWLKLHTAPWKRKLEEANAQIKATKSLIGLPDACGVLLLADNAARSFAPEDVWTLIARTLQSKKGDGSPVYSHVDRIVYFSATPKGFSKDGTPLHFWWPAYRNQPEKSVSDFLTQLGHKWFQYNAEISGTKAIEMTPEGGTFKSTSAEASHGFRIRS